MKRKRAARCSDVLNNCMEYRPAPLGTHQQLFGAGHSGLRTPLSVVCPVQATETADWELLYRWCALCRPQRQRTENPFIGGVPCAGHRDGGLRTPLSVVCPVQATETADWEPLYRWCALCRPQTRRTENPFISGVQSAVCTTVQSHQLFSFFKHPHPLLIF